MKIFEIMVKLLMTYEGKPLSPRRTLGKKPGRPGHGKD